MGPRKECKLGFEPELTSQSHNVIGQFVDGASRMECISRPCRYQSPEGIVTTSFFLEFFGGLERETDPGRGGTT